MFKFNEEHKKFIIENIKNTESDLRKLFNNKFNVNISLIQLSNFKSRNHLKSGLVGGQFQKGHKTFNKGLKQSDYMSEDAIKRIKKTMFKKGNIPHNHRPVGSERFTKNGYIEIKVKEPNKWRVKHRLIYEQEYGNIPKGHKVIFADGNKENFNIDNLLCVTENELLKLNGNKLIKQHSELTKTGLLIAKLIIKSKERIK